MQSNTRRAWWRGAGSSGQSNLVQGAAGDELATSSFAPTAWHRQESPIGIASAPRSVLLAPELGLAPEASQVSKSTILDNQWRRLNVNMYMILSYLACILP